jgi:hypothetical protein
MSPEDQHGFVMANIEQALQSHLSNAQVVEAISWIKQTKPDNILDLMQPERFEQFVDSLGGTHEHGDGSARG